MTPITKRRFKRELCRKLEITDSHVTALVAHTRGRIYDSLMYKEMLDDPDLVIFVSLLYQQLKGKIGATEYERIIERLYRKMKKMDEVKG